MAASITTIYLLLAIVLAVGFVTIAFVGLREDGYTKKMVYVASIPTLSMSIAYALMSLGVVTVETAGREQSVMRFVGYTFGLLSIAYLMKEVLDMPHRQFLKLSVALVMIPWFSFFSWLVTGLVESLFTLGSLLAYAYATYLLFRPLNALAKTIGGNRYLLFAKMRHLFVLCYGILILFSIISDQVLGLTNNFIGTIGAGYADAVLMYAIALLVVSSRDVFEAKLDRSELDTDDAVDSTPESYSGFPFLNGGDTNS